MKFKSPKIEYVGFGEELFTGLILSAENTEDGWNNFDFGEGDYTPPTVPGGGIT